VTEIAMERRPFATSTTQRSRAYLEKMFRLLRKQRRTRVAMCWVWIAAVAGFCFFVAASTQQVFMFLLGLGFVAYCLICDFARKRKWVNDNWADIPADDQEMRAEFHDNSLVLYDAVSVTELDWSGIYKAVVCEDWLLLYVTRNTCWCVPLDNINPISAVSMILKKANQTS